MLATTLLCLIVGIDAPESKQPFGQRAKQSLSNLLCYMIEAKIAPKTFDRNQRTMADVECRGADAGQYMVHTGMAWVYEKFDKGYDHLYPL